MTYFASKFNEHILTMKIFRAFWLVSILVLLASCNNYKDVAYFQNSGSLPAELSTAEPYNVRLMPKDLITITVNTTDPEAAAPFNLTVQSREASMLGGLHTTAQATLQQYLISNEGTIDFPVLGTLHVGGLTIDQTQSLVRERLAPYLKETPIVTVRMQNFKVSVLGEVNHPGQFSVNNEKVNVLEALAMAGDLTIWGCRDNVKLIREDAQGQRQIHELDLTDARLISSPYYQLEQNDVLYVTPNKTKARNSDVGSSTSLWFSAVSITVSLASLLFNILK